MGESRSKPAHGALARRTGAQRSTLALALLLIACGEPAERPHEDDPPFEPRRRAILILLDAARADRFGFDGYARDTTPEMDALGSRGLVFLKHYAQTTLTVSSIPQMIYSRYFVRPLSTHTAAIPLDDPRSLMQGIDAEAISLPRAFAQAGFVTAALSAHKWMKPGSDFAREFDELHDLNRAWTREDRLRKKIRRLWTGRKIAKYAPAEEVVDRAIDWISQHRRDDFFLYLHLMDTHSPHYFWEDARAFYGADAYRGDAVSDAGRPHDLSRELTGDDRRFVDAMYDGSLRYADRELGRLVRYLEERGVLADTLIAITSDHGESLLEVPGRFRHGGPWFESRARIPLVVHYPKKVEPGRVTSLTEMVDLAPTMLGLMDVPLPPGKSADGVDLSEIARGRRPPKRHAFATTVGRSRARESGSATGGELLRNEMTGVRGSRYKAIFPDGAAVLLPVKPPAAEAVTARLYDLSADPDETVDVRSERPEALRELIGVFRRELRPRFIRFLAAASHEQPRSVFGISAAGFDSDPAALDVEPGAAERRLPALLEQPTWARSPLGNAVWMLAGRGAGTLSVSFPLPNGDYRVSARACGRGRVGIGDADLVSIDVIARRLSDCESGEAVDIGVVEIRDETFRASLVPADEGPWFGISRFGFHPLLDAPEGPVEMDEEDLEGLRALGYLD